MKALLSLVWMLTGLGLVSLTMRRHAAAWPAAWRPRIGRAAAVMVRAVAAACIALSGTVAIRDAPQLGPIYWACYAMLAIVAIAIVHAYAQRRFLLLLTGAALLSATLLLSGLAAAPSAGPLIGAAP